MRVLSVLLILFLLLGCATATPPPPRLYLTAADANPVPPPIPMSAGPSGWQIAGAILLLPILIPLAALSSGSRSYGGNVSCKGKSYADGTKWRSSCS